MSWSSWSWNRRIQLPRKMSRCVSLKTTSITCLSESWRKPRTFFVFQHLETKKLERCKSSRDICWTKDWIPASGVWLIRRWCEVGGTSCAAHRKWPLSCFCLEQLSVWLVVTSGLVYGVQKWSQLIIFIFWFLSIIWEDLSRHLIQRLIVIGGMKGFWCVLLASKALIILYEDFFF